MNELILVHLIDKKPVGSNLGGSIPLHLTLVPWFYVNEDFHVTSEKLKKSIESSVSSVEAHADEEDLFGVNQNVRVMKLENTPELRALHSKLLSLVDQVAVDIESEWIGSKWSPHVTHKSDNELSHDETFMIEDIDLIYRHESTQNRIILDRFNLK